MKQQEPLAHSAKPDRNIPEQSYSDHVGNVLKLAEHNAKQAWHYYHGGEEFTKVVCLAAEFHDLGKLDEANQRILQSISSERHLPINHVDAGVAALLIPADANASAALLVNAHHAGLPDIPDECVNRRSFLRDRTSVSGSKSLIKHTDENLSAYRKIHDRSVRGLLPVSKSNSKNALLEKNGLLCRIVLSCLVDADHYDTARNYNDAIPCEGVPLNPQKRLCLLDTYIENLKEAQQNERTPLRTRVYQACRNADTKEGMYSCDSPVGTGKTTAVMAHLLKAAVEKGLRRIFVVLPFTNIIDQSVDIYRQALVGLNERREDVVAAQHHRAEFESLELRQYSFLWHAPIIVTTAVQFFETLASNRPSSLRKLHQLPGSAIFIDEAHAALPTHLWPQGWRWLKELRDNWNCHFVFGSGSLNKFWRLEEFEETLCELPELVAPNVRDDTMSYEDHRVQYLTQPEALGLDELLDWQNSLPGPRLLIVNTVQSAAVIADRLCEIRGKDCVEHLSTSLCPSDRKKTLDRVRERLANREDENWTLVATSCVEAGVDLSFRTGMRERCSLNSLVQIGGRINRKGEYKNAEVWDFQLRHDGLLVSHRAFDTSARVLNELFAENRVNPGSATEAMRREIRQAGLREISEEILKSERNLRFPDVAEKFRVIDSNTITVIVDEKLKERLKNRDKVFPYDIQNGSVQIWAEKEIKYDMQSLDGFPELRLWNLLYDDFLGYMAGVLPLLKQERTRYSFG
ncbi:MAG: CRISPR-associated endonuclease Cas3'' [Sedimentisphaerales bacterium]|nr:CRISPR-associated endonuclease Cas3'' [Sedimentisphaerales bacterium]